MPAVPRWRRLGLRGAGLFFLATLAIAAGGSEAAAATITIRAQVILASNQGTGTDERLIPVAKQLSEAFRGYLRFELISTHSGDGQLGQPWRAALPGDRMLEVTPTSVAERNYQFQVRVLNPKGEPLMNTSVRLGPGRPVFIGGLPHPPGILAIALSAQ